MYHKQVNLIFKQKMPMYCGGPGLVPLTAFFSLWLFHACIANSWPDMFFIPAVCLQILSRHVANCIPKHLAKAIAILYWLSLHHWAHLRLNKSLLCVTSLKMMQITPALHKFKSVIHQRKRQTLSHSLDTKIFLHSFPSESPYQCSMTCLSNADELPSNYQWKKDSFIIETTFHNWRLFRWWCCLQGATWGLTVILLDAVGDISG